METSEDPRGTDVAEGGYPEEQQPGAEPAGAGGRKREEHGDDAPDTSSSEDSGPDKATGNPGAAGG
jgi:hypothetical protein